MLPHGHIISGGNNIAPGGVNVSLPLYGLEHPPPPL